MDERMLILRSQKPESRSQEEGVGRGSRKAARFTEDKPRNPKQIDV
jgi:hypothetical protein